MNYEVICPECGKPAPWVDNAVIYGKRFGESHMCYWCKDCDTYVGCHQNTRKPLGTMATKELREWRKKAHAAFDELWKHGMVSRTEAYKMLEREFGREVHIGESDIETCQRIISLCTK